MSDKNKLGFWSIVLLGINAIIGSGIFGLPGKAYAKMGPASMLVLLFCMVLAVSIALCFAEASSWFEENGGPYLYAKEAFGDFIGFEVGFMKWAIGMIAWAAMANFFAITLSKIWPVMAETFYKNIIITVVLVGLGIINILGVKISKIVNDSITIGKLVPLFIFIIVGIFFIKGGNFKPFVIIPKGHTASTAFVAASISLFYAFTGFESLAVAAKDMENPKKNVPKALVTVMALVSLVYFLVLAISIGVLGGNLSGADTPVADAAGAILGNAGAYFITIGTVISVGGINIAASFLTPRSGVALADQGLVPKCVAKNNKHGAPYIAIIITVLGSLLIAWSGTFGTLLQISVISRFIQYIPTCIAVLVFRKKFVGKEINFRIPGGAFVPLLAVSISVWLLIKAGMASPMKIVWGLGGLLVAVPFYFFMTKVYNKKEA
ncbi:serine/threonine exchanger SteT [Clostridium tepidiprofundi DSM 19306]|uniref:Serine/threonine exchanger SteT n=1 Tax=Clostridium tepidiprofundi DSM 19306 TaxID=1121338 RepID=A0A151B3S6_9CLOT|nr:APC family permease [Clostridium tepidiprofundi]KYH34574.1 serine/threonine exchanger SteT [Clostridium tepidiprofundi DSM 19306]